MHCLECTETGFLENGFGASFPLWNFHTKVCFIKTDTLYIGYYLYEVYIGYYLYEVYPFFETDVILHCKCLHTNHRKTNV